MTQKCSVFSAIGTLRAVTVHPLLWLFIKMLNQSRSRRGCTVNSSPETEMPFYACASGLAWLGVCKHLCVCLGDNVEGAPWNELQQVLVKAQLCPTSHLTKPCFICLWDFGLVHARFLFTTESPRHPNTAFFFTISLSKELESDLWIGLA